MRYSFFMQVLFSLFIPFSGISQASLTKSTLLKTELPAGSKVETNAALIKTKTAILDEYMVSKDYTLTKTNAEVVVTSLGELKKRLQVEKWSIRLEGSSGVYRFQKDTLNVLAVVESVSGGEIIAMKLASMPSSSSPFTQTNKIVASDRAISTEFGRAVALTNNYAVVGVRLEDNDATGKNPLLDAGAAYIYERGSDNKWKQVQKLVASDRSKGANFGWSVSISGNTIVVGAIYEAFDATGRNEAKSDGAAYVFERGADGIWKQTQKLLSSAREGYNYFGTAVGIDENIIAVSAPGHSRDTTEKQEGYLGDAGAIFVFEKRGTNWRRTYKLVANDRQLGAGLGNSVAISGNYIIAGAMGQHTDANNGNRMETAGAAYIWERLEDGKWSKAKKLAASDRTPYDKFGFSVAISGDNAIVGANGVTLKRTDENNDPNSGEAYIFSRNENGEWKEMIAIIPAERKDRDLYGNSVGISGNYAIVGSPMGNTKSGDVGIIYVYWKNPQGKWVPSQKLSAADEGMFSNFGGAVAIHKDFVITGAHIESRDVAGKNALTNAGAAYIFIRTEKRTANPVTPKQVPKAPTNKSQ